MKKIIMAALATTMLVGAGSLFGNNDKVGNPEIKFYALDCGTMHVANMASFDREGRFVGQSNSLIIPCYLIRHPKGDMIWDTGFDQSIADHPVAPAGGFRPEVTVKLTDQLTMLDLSPADIEYVAISHLHPDHSGNVNLFPDAKFVVNKREYEYMFSDELRKNEGWFNLYNSREGLENILYDDAFDLFGDESVMFYSTPGHTPGSSVLKVRLKNAGALLLSGDLYSHEDARKFKSIPVFNLDADITVRSMEKFEKLAAASKARVIIEHDRTHFNSLPTFPDYLD